MKMRHFIYFLTGTLLILSSTLSLKAADEQSLKQLESLLPSQPNEQPKALDLSGVDMRTRNLCGTKDKKIDFRKANFRGANFSGMELCYVDFEGANLEQASFEGANIKKCNFRYVQGPANFSRATLKFCGFNNSKLLESKFTDAILESVGFDFADLRNANFDRASLIAVNFYSADLTGYSHVGAVMDRTSFEKAIGVSLLD